MSIPVASAISFAVVLYWRATNGSGKLWTQLFCWWLLPVVSRHSVRMLWVCLGLCPIWPLLTIPIHPWAWNPRQKHQLVSTPSFSLSCPHQGEIHRWGKNSEWAMLPCLPAQGEWDGDGDQLAHVNYGSGLNIKGSRYKKQRCEKTGKEKEERIGVMLQEEVFARSKGLYSMR